MPCKWAQKTQASTAQGPLKLHEGLQEAKVTYQQIKTRYHDMTKWCFRAAQPNKCNQTPLKHAQVSSNGESGPANQSGLCRCIVRNLPMGLLCLGEKQGLRSKRRGHMCKETCCAPIRKQHKPGGPCELHQAPSRSAAAVFRKDDASSSI